VTATRVVFTPEARTQLVELYRHIAASRSPDAAARYTEAIAAYCDGLRNIPQRGVARDDIRPGLRVTSYRRRVVIAFHPDAERVAIIAVFYGGQDYEASLLEGDGDAF
jgi:toxin ParE1/3/4